MKARSVIIAVLLVWSVPTVSVAADDDAPLPGTDGPEIILANVAVGDVLKTGRRTRAGCLDLDITLVTTKPDRLGRWSIVSVSEDCKMTLLAKWSGDLTDGPKDVINTMSPEAWDDPSSSFHFSGGGVTAPAAICKTNKQRVYTYGGGGPSLDKLTRIDHTVETCANGNTAWIPSLSGTCVATTLPLWRWVNDFCGTRFQNLGPTTGSAYHSMQGAFYCAPTNQPPCNISNPDGYFHDLISNVLVNPNGSITCSYTASGQWVFGPNRQILQGCS